MSMHTFFNLKLTKLYTDPDDHTKITEKSRMLGLVVVRGTQVSLVSPEDGMEEIANPFIASEEDME